MVQIVAVGEVDVNFAGRMRPIADEDFGTNRKMQVSYIIDLG